MSILHVNGSKLKYCVLHNGMITRNSVPDGSNACDTKWRTVSLSEEVNCFTYHGVSGGS